MSRLYFMLYPRAQFNKKFSEVSFFDNSNKKLILMHQEKRHSPFTGEREGKA